MSIFSPVNTLINNTFLNKGKEEHQPLNNTDFSFGDALANVSKDNQKVVVGNDGSALLNFHKKEEKVLTKVPKKGTKNVYDLIAEIERFERMNNHKG